MQSSLFNGTKSTIVSKVDCAKECPCGVAAIPVPDQWLEVMVTGGFKVWHIVFIIIALIVTLVVVYCCFHRCRIPRTKQEIEADLMRTNLTSKFRDYLQEFPNEQTTFLEALKKVQEMEEKLELDDALLAQDASARKRLGWLKLKGKGAATKEPAEQTPGDKVDVSAEPQPNETVTEAPSEVITSKSNALAAPAAPEVEVAPVAPPETSTNQETLVLATEPRAARPLRRRRHKPNLSRSKGAREAELHQGIPDDVARDTRGSAGLDPVAAAAVTQVELLPPGAETPKVSEPAESVNLGEPSGEKRSKHRSKSRKEATKSATRNTVEAPRPPAEPGRSVAREENHPRQKTRSTRLKS